MSLRPLRTATITFGLVAIPVKFYTATRQEDISFNLIHESCGSRVNRKYWCPVHEKIVEYDELIRGYQFTKGKYVTFTDEELEALESDDNRAVDITEFLDLKQIDPVYFERAYFLGPGDGGGKTYNLLSHAMKKQNKVALARWVTNNRENIVILRPYENGIILHTMYYADEVRDFSALDIPQDAAKEKEVKLAEMLIDELTEKKFNPLAYKDEYRDRLMDRIEAKAKGKNIITEVEEEEEVGEVIDIMEALQRSLEGGRGKKGSKREEEGGSRSRSAKPARARRKAS
jgi:DNA end-binding protein Ku